MDYAENSTEDYNCILGGRALERKRASRLILSESGPARCLVNTAAEDVCNIQNKQHME